MRRLALPIVLFPAFLPLPLAGCGDGYSPNTYASTAAQEEAAVQRGTIIGVRQVTISADGTIGAAAGGAAGGVAGAQVAGAPLVTALGAIGGSLVGGIGGSAAAKVAGNTKAWEYIVQEEPGDKLVSVTQTSKIALPLGQHVLVIAGTQQARIVPDYTVQTAAAVTNTAKNSAAPNGAANFEIDIGPVPPESDAVASLPAAPDASVSDPAAVPAPTPIAVNPVAAPAAPSPAPGEAATAKTVNNPSPATVTASSGTTATPIQAAQGASPPAPASSSTAATP